MKKITIAAASFYKQGYSFNEEFSDLPEDVKNEIKVICTCLAEKLHGVFSMGFYDEDASVYFEALGEESDHDFDEIGAKLEIDKLKAKSKELIKSLSLWYIVFRTKSGEKLRKDLLS